MGAETGSLGLDYTSALAHLAVNHHHLFFILSFSPPNCGRYSSAQVPSLPRGNNMGPLTCGNYDRAFALGQTLWPPHLALEDPRAMFPFLHDATPWSCAARRNSRVSYLPQSEKYISLIRYDLTSTILSLEPTQSSWAGGASLQNSICICPQ